MKRPDELTREIEALRNRLSRLSQASLHINESLDFDTVLQGVLDSACSLTGARYGVITLLDEAGQPMDFLSSGMTPEEDQGLWDVPDGWRFFEYFCGDSRNRYAFKTCASTSSLRAFPNSTGPWQ